MNLSKLSPPFSIYTFNLWKTSIDKNKNKTVMFLPIPKAKKTDNNKIRVNRTFKFSLSKIESTLNNLNNASSF